MTPFSELAMRIAEDINDQWACCIELYASNRDYLEKFFMPNKDERKEYKMDGCYWLESDSLTNIDNNSFRILILLMAERHWLEYKNEL